MIHIPADSKATLPCVKLIILMAAVVLTSACVAPRELIRKADEQRKSISRGLADVVDSVDQALGEPRIEDQERIVQLKVGIQPEYWKESEFGLNLPVRFRIPIPAIERRANIYLQVDTTAEASDGLTDVSGEFEDNKSFAAGIISRLSEKVDSGMKLKLFWDGGPQTSFQPFLRYNEKADPWRYYTEQQVEYETTDIWGGRTGFQIDRIIDKTSFIRMANWIEYREMLNGIDCRTSLIYRRSAWWNAVLSIEIGQSFNPHQGAAEGGGTDPEKDGDKSSFRVRFAGKTGIYWIEYEIEPGVDYYWHHDDPMDYGIAALVRIIFEDFLRK